MPELPEVETVVRDLRPLLVGRRFTAVRFGRKRLRRPWSPWWCGALCGRFVGAVTRRGKWIIVELCEGRLLVHLGMTGQLTAGRADRPAATHTHLVADLDDGTQLRFRDERRFGSIDYFNDPADLDVFLADRLGPEPFDLDPAEWRAAFRGTARPVKAALLDQALVAGVGNIYADEALFIAGIHPATPANALRPARAERLRRALPEVLRHAIDRRGSSIRNYVGGGGERGGYPAEFRVYGRTGEPCPRCRRPIERIRLAGRSTHFCPRCQK
jgi:formamidopyrimidine-DNA glycosylase